MQAFRAGRSFRVYANPGYLASYLTHIRSSS